MHIAYATPAMDSYVKGLRNAESKGFAAGMDPKFTERDNPYDRYEHRTCWIDGFRRARAQESAGRQNEREIARDYQP